MSYFPNCCANFHGGGGFRAIFHQKEKVDRRKEGRRASYFPETDVVSPTDVDTDPAEACDKLVKRSDRSALTPNAPILVRDEVEDGGVDGYLGGRAFGSGEETLPGGESACAEDEEYFKLPRVSIVADTGALSATIGRDILTGRLVIMLDYLYYLPDSMGLLTQHPLHSVSSDLAILAPPPKLHASSYSSRKLNGLPDLSQLSSLL